MMINPQRIVAATLLASALALASAPVRAQGGVSLQATLGVGTGRGGPQAGSRSGPLADALAAVSLHSASAGGFIAGVSGTVQGAVVRTDDLCVITPDGGGCRADFPLFSSAAVLAGWESADAGVRILAGPAVFAPDDDGTVAGLTSRLDLAVAAARRVTPVFSLRASLLPSFRGDAITLLGAGIGLRVR